MYGRSCEVEPASKRVMELGRTAGGRYLGDEISAGDWASRHDRYATRCTAAASDGQAVMMSWHCEDAALNYSVLPQVREEWHAIVARYRERYGIFDDWGMFAYTSGAHKPWADYLVEIDVGIWEQRLDEETWAAWVSCKREIAEVTLKYGGSITACHGATREGDAELVPAEMGSAWEVVKRIKRALDPNNVMNPGKQSLDEAYEEDGMSIFRLGDQAPPPPQRVTDTVVMRFDHVYEVDPALMERDRPAADAGLGHQRIVDCRWDHLDWMHLHFADEVLLAGEESETMPASGPTAHDSRARRGRWTTGCASATACCRTIRWRSRSR